MVFEGLLKGGIDRGSLPDPARWLRVWQDSLLECLPESLRNRLRTQETRIALYLAGAHADARLEKGDDARSLGRVDWTDSAAIEQVMSRADRSATALALVVPEQAVLLRRFSMPSQVRDNLPRVLGYEIDRLTPFSADDLYYDYRVVPGGNRERLEIELAYTRRNQVTDWLDALGGMTFSSHVVTWPGAWAGANLLPASARGSQGKAGRWISRMLWALILLLTLAVLVTPLVQKRQIAIELLHLNAQARGQAEKVAGLRQTLDNELRSASYVLDQKRSAPYLVELLRRLTELIPENTWVNQLEYKEGSVQIRGESTQATTLIELLTVEPAFRNIGFRSPVVGVPNTDRERYHITFDYVPTGGAK